MNALFPNWITVVKDNSWREAEHMGDSSECRGNQIKIPCNMSFYSRVYMRDSNENILQKSKSGTTRQVEARKAFPHRKFSIHLCQRGMLLGNTGVQDCVCVCVCGCGCGYVHARTPKWGFKWGEWTCREANITAAKCNTYEFFYVVFVWLIGSGVVTLWDNEQMKTGFDFFVQQELASLLWSGDMWRFIYLFMHCWEGKQTSLCDNLAAICFVQTSTWKHDFIPLLCWLLHSELSGSLTLPENSFLGPDIGLQLSSSDVDANRLRQVADSLRHHSFSGVARLQSGCLQPNIFTLFQKKSMSLLTKILRTILTLSWLM